MYPHKQLDYTLEIKSIDESGVFAGYGSVFGVVDNQKDIVLNGAFADTLSKRGKGDIKLLWQHDMTQPIGVIEEIREDENGLYIKGRANAKKSHEPKRSI